MSQKTIHSNSRETQYLKKVVFSHSMPCNKYFLFLTKYKVLQAKSMQHKDPRDLQDTIN